jgi:hypothetical protein
VFFPFSFAFFFVPPPPLACWHWGYL